jgi:RNA polymerase sigma-70 factor (ECF subfamily)
LPFSLDAAAEAAILAGARGGADGRERAFDELFRALREPVLALALHLTGRRADAEDALQEAFLDVHRALDRFRGEARLSTWVYRIAVRAAIRVRARRREAGHLAGARERGQERGAGSAHPPSGAEPSTGGEADAHARIEAGRVAAALDRLPAEQRAVLSLFALGGLGHREIAGILGVPEGTVWSRLHAARRALAVETGRAPARG